MKIAWLHLDYCGGPQEKNTEKILQGIHLAAEQGANWVLTPEMALQGYFMTRTGNPYELAYLGRNQVYTPFQEATRKHKLKLFLGCGDYENCIPHNSLVVIDQEGKLIAKHSKIKVVRWVTECWAVSGRELSVKTIDGLKVGLLVCADAYFETYAAQLAKQGAELIIVAAAWPPGGCGGPPEKAWSRSSLAAGRLPLLVANQTGNNGMNLSQAQSAIVQGDQLLCSYKGPEAVLLAEYDEVKHKIISDSFQVFPFKYLPR